MTTRVRITARLGSRKRGVVNESLDWQPESQHEATINDLLRQRKRPRTEDYQTNQGTNLKEILNRLIISEVIDHLGMKWTSTERCKFIDNIKVVDLRPLDVPYPTDDYYMATTKKGKAQWDTFWAGRGLKDKRYNKGERRKTLVLDKSRLQYTIPQDESVIFRDADTKEIFLIVLRNFVPDEELRQDFVRTCRQILEVRRDDRREDPGQLVHFGYTCGSRHRPDVQLATNCKRISPERHRELNNETQGMAAIGWNMLRSRVPQEIIDDYNDTVVSIGCPRMDMGKTGDAKFAYRVGGAALTFNAAGEGLELPPPSGLSAVNYARFTHRENNGNRWFVAVTCLAAADPRIGGNFYNASYGVMMLAASNTVTAFQPTHYHGTTLYEIELDPWPRDGYERRPDGGENIGFSFEVSKGLRNAKRSGDARRSGRARRAAGQPVRPGLKRFRQLLAGRDRGEKASGASLGPRTEPESNRDSSDEYSDNNDGSESDKDSDSDNSEEDNGNDEDGSSDDDSDSDGDDVSDKDWKP